MTFAQILQEFFSALIGVIFALVGIKAIKDEGAQKKATTAAFWFILAFTFICGYWLPKWITGACIVLMAIITGINGVAQSKSDVPDHESVRKHADEIGYKIFIPALVIAIGSVVLTWLGAKVPACAWITSNNALCIGSLLGLVTVLIMTKAPIKYSVIDGVRLMDNVGVTGILPQLLSALGALFTAAGVGDVISKGVSAIVPENSKLIACIVYCVAMALFTMIMGNGFAAFSVITIGIGIPFLIANGCNPIVVGALGLTAGYCGTLMTPMAANFNIMPAALLEVKNKYTIIKSQIPVALCMLVIHIILMYIFA